MELEHKNNCVLIKYIPDKGEAAGYFDPDNMKIYISTRLPLLEREVVYLHELSHRECYLKGCKCWKSTYWCEYHAMKGEIQKVLARRSKRLNKAYIKSVEREREKYRKNPQVWGKHHAALKRLMKTELFKKLFALSCYFFAVTLLYIKI